MPSEAVDAEFSKFNLGSYREEILQKIQVLPREAQMAIAARAAWRVIPMMFAGWESSNALSKWWGKYGSTITCKLVLALLNAERSSGILRGYFASNAAVAAVAADAAAFTIVSTTASTSAASASAASAAEAAHLASYAAYVDVCDVEGTAYVYLYSYAADAAAYAANSGMDMRSQLMQQISEDIDRAADRGLSLKKTPLWTSSFDNNRLSWLSFAEEVMRGIEGSSRLYEWLRACAGGDPPLAEMRLWFNDWWLDHPMNAKGTPAFKDLSGASRPPMESVEAVPQSIIRKKYLPPNYSVALSADGAAQKLTDTAEMYKEALRAFLACPDTQAPITVSVEAPWGAGKTSFLHCLRGALETQNQIPTVWFNPWKHEAGKTLRAAFAVAYERQMAEKLSWLGLWRRRLTLSWKRLSGNEQVLLLARLALWVLGLGALLWLWCHGMDLMTKHDAKEGTGLNAELAKKLPLLGVPLLLWGLLKDVMSSFGSPLKLDMVSVFTRNQHQEGVDDLHRFHEDFERLMCSYTPGSGPLERFTTDLRNQTDPHWVVQWRTFGRAALLWGCRWARRVFYTHLIHAPKKLQESERPRWSQDRVVVFIDDLDRCEAPKAAEVLQSLHLMLSGGGHERRKGEPMPPGVICILGMDREKVAAAVAAKHEKLLPILLTPSSDGKLAPHQALGFGHEFLEKFVQITVHLPGLAGKDQDQFLRMITGWKGDELRTPGVPAAGASQRAAPAAPAAASTAAAPQPVPAALEKEAEAKRVQAAVEEVDTHLHDGQAAFICASYVADALEHNPRRLKQFVNLFRLRLYLAAAMNLLDLATLDPAEQKRLHPDKLSAHDIAKLVALELCCPQTMNNLREGATIALKRRVQQEHKDSRLAAIIKMIDFKPDGEADSTSAYDLGKAPVEKYFQLFVSAALPPESSVAE